MSHSIIVLSIQVVVWFLTGSWWHGAVAGSFYFIGREIAQAEYRTIEKNYNRKRATAPWWCGFEPRVWTRKGMLDWVVPTAVTVSTALGTLGFLGTPGAKGMISLSYPVDGGIFADAYF